MDQTAIPKKPHVLFLPRWYPHRYDPMPGLFIERHGIAVAKHCQVTVLYLHQDSSVKGKKAEVIINENEKLPTIRIYYPQASSGIGIVDKLVNAWNFYRYHRKGIAMLAQRYGKPDLIHVHVLTRHGITAFLEKVLHHTPYVITEHWTRYLPLTNSYRGWLRKRLTSLVAKHASAIMPVTENLRDAMKSCGIKNDHYVVIPNVVNMEMFHIVPKTQGDRRKRIIHVSCFDDRQKNITGILRVLKQLCAERNDFICDMVGDGIDYQNITDYSEKLEIPADKVIFYGLRENEELAAMMAQADFMVMFSNYENLPVVILESYACGVPVLSTDVGGIREHLTQNLGILIPARDEHALYEKMVHMLNHTDQYHPEELRKYATGHFSNEVIGDQLWKVYSESIC